MEHNQISASLPQLTRRTRLGALVALTLLAVAALAMIPIQTAHAQSSTLNLQVYSGTLDSKQISGYYTVLYDSSSSVVATGFTPTSFTVNEGETYSIQADDYGSCHFAYWIVPVTGGADDVAQNPYTFTATADNGPGQMLLGSVYNCSGGTTTFNLTIASQDLDGNLISGYYTVLNQSNSIVATGFTKHTFTVNSGQTYTVQVDDYGSCHFDHWLDTGSSQSYRTVTISGDAGFDAVMKCGNQTTPMSQLTIKTIESNGTTITGFYTVLNQSSSIVATGFTPTTFELNNGQTYTVQVDDYGSCHFDHWSDTGSTTSYRTISLQSDAGYVALMNCGSDGGGPSSVTIHSVDQNFNAIKGYYTVLFDSDGNQLATGFTPSTFPTTVGQSYSVQAYSYGSCTFTNWSDANTANPRSFTGTSSANSSPLTFTAVYDCR